VTNAARNAISRFDVDRVSPKLITAVLSCRAM
jgi:hypothetical protein